MASGGALRGFSAGLGRGATYLLGLAVAVGLWFAILLSGGVLLYRVWFNFDATDAQGWLGVYAGFLAGGTVAFDFVALAALLVLAGALGALLLAFRLPAIGVQLAHSRLAGSALARLQAAFSSHAPRPAVWRMRKAKVRGQAQSSPRLRGLGPARRLLSLLARRAASGQRQAVPAGPVAASAALPAVGIELPDPPPAAVLPDTAPQAVGSAPPPAEEEPAPTAHSAPAAHDEEGAEPVFVGGAAPAAGDDLAITRSMALFDVWVDPPPSWMAEALAEELAGLSAAGWLRLPGLGRPGRDLLRLAAAFGMLPAESDRRAAADEALAAVTPDRDADEGEPVEEAWLREEEAAVPAPPEEPPAMSLCAGWLCELLDNYVALEGKRAGALAEEFEARWGGLFRDTGEHLRQAMAAMTEEDWASLDRFPDRAGRARILSDRLREDFRGHRWQGPAEAAREAAGEAMIGDATTPWAPMEAVPTDGMPMAAAAAPPPLGDGEGRDAEGDARAFMLSLFEGRGHRVRTLGIQPGAESDAAEEFLVEGGAVVLLLRLQRLGGCRWHLPEGTLGPWQAGDAELPSPCRAVWQRLSLMRAMGRERRAIAGLVVVTDGHLEDEAGIGQAVGQDHARSGVGLLWLREGGRVLPTLDDHLRQLAGGPAAGLTDAPVPAR